MVDSNKVIAYILKHIPKQENLKKSFLYRMIGEKLFQPKLWKMSRKGMAGGLALGVFIALTPTVGAQMFLSGIAAYFLRVNIPLAVACAWITNPFTIPIIYSLQYKLGMIVCSGTLARQVTWQAHKFGTFMKHAQILWVGSLISASFFAAISYVLVIFLWDIIENEISKRATSN